MPQQSINIYLRLLNGRRFQTAMYQAASSVRSAKGEMQSAASAGSELGRAGHAAEAGLYAVGAASRYLTYGVAAATGAWVAMGIQFNSTMEQNTLAFSHFAGGVEQGKKLVSDLWEIAASTPFSFEDITSAARRFMAFGFNVQETTDLLRIMGDTMSLTGGGTDEIMRFAKAMGDIRAKGRLMQQEMNQMANLGIPILDVLQKGGLDLTEKQMRNIGRAGISADEALNAIRSGLKQTFGGGAQKYLGTFAGQWQRLRDNIRKMAGESTEGIFGWLKDGLKWLNEFVTSAGGGDLGNKIRSGLETGIKLVGAAFLFVKERAKEFLAALAPAAPFFNNILLPIIKGFALGLIGTFVMAWKLLIAVIKVVAPILGWIGEKLAFLKPVFFGLGFILSFLVGGIIKAAGFLMKFGGVIGMLGRIIWFIATPFRMWIGLWVKIFSFIGRGIAFIGRFIGSVAKIQGAFRAAGNAIWTFFGKLLNNISNKLGSFGGIFFKAGTAAKNAFVRGVKGIFGAILTLFSSGASFAGEIGRKVADWLNDNTPFGDKVSIGPVGFRIPALAMGGDISGGGYALVGEAGPEVVRLPTGSSVIPNRPARVRSPNQQSQADRGAVFDTSGVGGGVIQLVVGRRVLAEVMGDEIAQRRARS